MRGKKQTKLTQALNPTALNIIDESHKHAGHAAMQGKILSRVSLTSLGTIRLMLVDGEQESIQARVTLTWRSYRKHLKGK